MKQLIAWVEIPVKDFTRAVKFYENVLGLEFTVADYGVEKMAFFPSGEGAISEAPDFYPSRDGVLVSLNSGSELDAILDRITEQGGVVVKTKTKIEAENRGYFALFLDSEGNKVGLYGD